MRAMMAARLLQDRELFRNSHAAAGSRRSSHSPEERFSACFDDRRTPNLVEHSVATMVMRCVVGIALGYGDLIDHG
jgi:hypothetical protein